MIDRMAHERMSTEHFDVLVVGAGLSGIGAGYHLQEKCPNRSYAILEARESIGGTWDLFRYPGIRSDSDMYTLGYSFRPWTGAKAIADGPSILRYVRDTDEAADLVQRTFMRAMAKLGDLRAAEVFRTWILRIGANVRVNLRLPSDERMTVHLRRTELDELGLGEGDRVLVDIGSAKVFMGDYSI